MWNVIFTQVGITVISSLAVVHTEKEYTEKENVIRSKTRQKDKDKPLPIKNRMVFQSTQQRIQNNMLSGCERGSEFNAFEVGTSV